MPRWTRLASEPAKRGERRPARPRRGAIFIAALGIIVILTGMVLVFAQSMRTEVITSDNRLSYAQADAVEQGAERWVLAQVEANQPDALTITRISSEGLQVGNGYFWVIRPNPTTDQQYAFGIVDEASKLNLNTTSPTRLFNLPNMQQPIADAIADWHNPASKATADGAESSFYEAPDNGGYEAKNAAFETVEELLLVRGVTKDVLYGQDLNRDGVIDAGESALGGGAANQLSSAFTGGGAITTRGWLNDFTVYSTEPNQTSQGGKRVLVGERGSTSALRTVLKNAKVATYDAVVDNIYPPGAPPKPKQPPQPRKKPRYANIGDVYIASKMSIADFKKVADNLTTSDPTQPLLGLINVNTAPKEVLMCLPGLTPADADALIGQRASASDLSNIGWVFDALPGSPPKKAAAITREITAKSFVYSADIVAVSGDGRAFKRVRIVVDSTQVPAKIVYRRELTSLGWPLPPEIRSTLRSGHQMQMPQMGLAMSNGR